MTDLQGLPARRGIWPWVALGVALIPAAWSILVFEHDVDPEFPRVARQTYSAYPPAAYRLAEAGDTIDCIAVYISSAALVLAAWGCCRQPRRRLRHAALALSMAAFWHAATPGPLLDGWYGLGWRTIFDSRAPSAQRAALAVCAMTLAAIVALAARPWNLRTLAADARTNGVLGLTAVALGLMIARQLPWIDREPFGYWPRWVYAWGVLAWALAMLRLAPPVAPGRRGVLVAAALVAVSLGLDFGGRGIFWYQRPIGRLKELIPGRLYLSAMPTYDGLKLAQGRYRFKTIINLFPEFTDQRSPYWPEEQRFAREHGIACFQQPAEDPTGIKSIPQTLALADDPANWPVLVHCHASMDRSPAWVGMYRFAKQGWPLEDAIREIERHRGSRPKSSVTLLYNRMLPRLDPRRSAEDPTAILFRQNAAGTPDPLEQLIARSQATAPERR
ncbi:protein tyrosine phosphatase [Paludisphaera mucosa]|uniref:Protein tyrosine phosphatase n=1 Tax=Paludisphaera mucosa TaxID=3030827 RepID=A0ABT6F8E1_9BACT|nr:protein tyrosine phosphatase [Paludisphaera mucosa]MDG3003855.1 protein tyrosine phosphatase [Paludisphaera mucosa]